MTHVLGLTGGIGTGKTTVSNLLKHYQIPVVDADFGAREVVKPSSPALVKIRESFGDNVIQENGELDRKKLGEIIFNDSQLRAALNSIVQPDIRHWILAERDSYIESGNQLVVLDIPLLYEQKYENEVDSVMVITTEKANQLNRLSKRDGLSAKEVKERIAAQMPLKEKEQRADIVIENNGTKEELKKRVKKWLNDNGYHV